jgi:hypothetical protein
MENATGQALSMVKLGLVAEIEQHLLKTAISKRILGRTNDRKISKLNPLPIKSDDHPSRPACSGRLDRT